jgi:hypothetical protein
MKKLLKEAGMFFFYGAIGIIMLSIIGLVLAALIH